MTDLFVKLRNSNNLQTYRHRQMTTELGKELTELARQEWPSWSAQRIAAIRPITRHLSLHTEWEIRRPVAELNILVHAIADDMKGFHQWHESLTDEQRKSLGYAYGKSQVWSLAAKIIGERTSENLDQRIKFTGALIEGCEQLGHIEVSGDEIHLQQSGALVRHIVPQLLTQNGLFTHGPKLAEQSPAGGITWALMANEQTAASQFKQAAESWSKAIDHASPDDKKRQEVWREQHARILKHVRSP